ncbi:Multidrug resistance-associated protein 1, partial [Quaeritorhiza haematococci]
IWLTYIVDKPFNLSSQLYIGIYGVWTGAIAIGVLARGFMFSAAVLKKSVSLHDRVLKAILRAPMSFFDITPIGNILSHFARHLFLIDDFLPEGALQVLSFAPILLGTVTLVSVVIPYFWATLPVYFALGYILVKTCMHVEEKLKTLEASNKSPMFAHLSSTLEGLFSIRLYGAQNRFESFNRTLIDADHKALYSLMLVKNLQALYLDLISVLFIYITALFVVAFNVTGSIAGLAVSNALQLLLFVQWLIRLGGDVHHSMTSVAAVVYFGDHVTNEIEFKNVLLRYHRYGVAVLKSVSFRIHPGEKVGVVGRSGSGKTTLLSKFRVTIAGFVALLRMTEAVEGNILIDGIDISQVGLHDVRGRIAVIPQEPILLTGTVRSNLDPSGLRSDEEVWKALKAVHLGQKIQEMPAKLETSVTENGKAFTLAERQLFCIARAILLKPKIVVFDEPTMAVDNDSDTLLQQTITSNFADMTVIVLASRFNLIMKTDRIMVMEAGKIVEFDTPLSLLNDPRSKFMRMVNQTGDVDPAKLKKLALAHSEEKKGGAAGASVASSSSTSAAGMVGTFAGRFRIAPAPGVVGAGGSSAGSAGSGRFLSPGGILMNGRVTSSLSSSSGARQTSTSSPLAHSMTIDDQLTVSTSASDLSTGTNEELSVGRSAGNGMPKSLVEIFGDLAMGSPSMSGTSPGGGLRVQTSSGGGIGNGPGAGGSGASSTTPAPLSVTNAVNSTVEGSDGSTTPQSTGSESANGDGLKKVEERSSSGVSVEVSGPGVEPASDVK